jgi:hypothetical protein
VKLKTIVVFSAGYVLGTRAGRERYAQIAALAQSAATRIEQRQSARAAGSESQHAQGDDVR